MLSLTKDFRQILADVLDNGKIESPRRLKTLELTDYQYSLPPYVRFMSFPSRKLNLNYIKDELLWYLKGDPYDLSIVEKAKIWADHVMDNRLNSNYGFYIFREGGLDYVTKCLAGDHSSRRAVITILGKEHLYTANRDVPCTVSLGFRIRDGELCASVHMRSQDAIFGMGNDVPFFSIVQEMVLRLLTRSCPELSDLSMGRLTVSVESFHVYERHFELLEKLVTEETDPPIIPEIEAIEIGALVRGIYDLDFPFTRWLCQREMF